MKSSPNWSWACVALTVMALAISGSPNHARAQSVWQPPNRLHAVGALGGYLSTLDGVGSRLAVAQGQRVVILDIGTDGSLVVRGTSGPVGGHIESLTMGAGFVLAFTKSRQVVVVDLNDPAAPRVAGAIPQSTSDSGPVLVGRTAVRCDSGLSAHDLTDLDYPVETGRLPRRAVGCDGPIAAGPFVAVVDYLDGSPTSTTIHFVDVTDSRRIALAGSINLSYAVTGLTWNNDTLLALGQSRDAYHLVAIRTDPTSPPTITADALVAGLAGWSSTHQIHLAEGLLFLVDVAKGIAIIDGHDSASPRLVASIDEVTANGVAIHDHRLYVVPRESAYCHGCPIRSSKIAAFDLSSPAAPRRLADRNVLDVSRWVAVTGRGEWIYGLVQSYQAVNGWYPTELRVVDAADPSRPRLRGRLSLESPARSASGSTAWRQETEQPSTFFGDQR